MGDVDFEAGWLSVRRQWEPNEAGEWEATPLKTARSRRTLDMPALVVAQLREQKARVNEIRLRSGKKWDERFDCVFPGERGRIEALSYIPSKGYGLLPLGRAGRETTDRCAESGRNARRARLPTAK
jgi:hypothetical protein